MEKVDKTDIMGGPEVHLIVTRRARSFYLDSELKVECLSSALNVHQHSKLLRGPAIFIRSYGNYGWMLWGR